jgi:hypothetical protein
MVLRLCHSSATMMSQWCYSGLTVVFQWCYSGVVVHQTSPLHSHLAL